MLYLIATLNIQPGSLNTVLAAARPCIAETRKETGCVSYDLHVDVDDDTRLVFVERWEHRAALEGHFNAPHLKTWRDAGSKYFTSTKIEIIEDGRVEIL